MTEKIKNPNAPKKGSQIKVDPIKDIRSIKSIKKLLAENYRDLAIFTVGINTALRASDLIKLTFKEVKDKIAGEDLRVIEKKTGNVRTLTLNAQAVDAIGNLITFGEDNGIYTSDDEYLFQSRKGGNALTVPSINRLVKGWCRDLNLKGNFGSHTLRKTFGYHKRVTFNHGIESIMKAYGHSSQQQTLTYICVQEDEIRDIYMDGL